MLAVVAQPHLHEDLAELAAAKCPDEHMDARGRSLLLAALIYPFGLNATFTVMHL